MGYSQETRQKLRDKGFRYLELRKRADARIARYPLSARIFQFYKFSGLRKKREHFKWMTFAYGCMALASVR